MSQSSLLGMGLYTPSAVARMARMPVARVNRWVRGYQFKDRKGAKRQYGPLLRPDLPVLDGKLALSFYDLIDVLCVRAFEAHGVPMQTMRKAALAAAEQFQEKHPFCLRRFRTDGRTIFAQFEDELERLHLLDLIHKQYAIEKILEPCLKDVEYEFDKAARWWPLGRDRRVLLDPHRSLGAPIVQQGVPTAALYGNYHAEGGNVIRVAKWFDVTTAEVEDAVEFEQRLAA